MWRAMSIRTARAQARYSKRTAVNCQDLTPIIPTMGDKNKRYNRIAPGGPLFHRIKSPAGQEQPKVS